MSVPTYSATLTMLLALTGNGTNAQNVPMPLGLPFSNNLSPGMQSNITLAVGDNTVTPPQTPQNLAQVCVILFQAPAGTITIKGIAADTGYVIGTSAPFMVLPINSSAGSFVLNVSVTTTATIYFL